MTYREAWEAIYFRHCQETCDYAYMDNCQEEKCEYYMALQALNRQYYAECGSVWVKPKADRKTEPSNSEKPNNCEHITEDGVTCAKYPACDDCLDNPLNKVKGSERLVKGSEQTEPTISKMEQVDEPTTEDCSTVEPQYEMGMGTLKCDNCSEYGSFKCTKCDGEMYFKRLGPKDEPQTERSE